MTAGETPPASSSAAGPSSPRTLAGAAWLVRPATQRVLAALSAAGATARVVGGAVRNALIGRPVADVDIATTARPEEVMRLAAAAGLDAIPTGLQHGTVTVVADRIAYEVTTLRRDVETDGRHAVIAFTDDWAADASRRDFTINALYCDADGTIHDPLGGLADIPTRRVRFIGDATARIREDYLRILRFFRFHAQLGAGDLDAAGLAAAGAERDGLTRLSAERVRVELMKLLETARAVEVVGVMGDHGFLTPLLGMAPAPSRLAALVVREDAIATHRHDGECADVMLRLSALAIAVEEDGERLADRLKLANSEREALTPFAPTLACLGGMDDRAARAHLHRVGADRWRREILAGWSMAGTAPGDPRWRDLALLATRWPIPVLPLKGADVVTAGEPPGPRVGALLRALEAEWIASDFTLDHARLLARLAALRRSM